MLRELKQQSRQRGQAMIEYIVALSAVFMIFYVTGGIIFPVEETPCTNRNGDLVSPRDCLIDNMKGYYQGHSYALSLSEYPDSSPGASIPSIIDNIVADICDDGACSGLDSLPGLGSIPEEFPPSLETIVDELIPNITIDLKTLLGLLGLPSEVTDLVADLVGNPTLIDIPFPP